MKPCKCGGVCDDHGDGTPCMGQVIAIDNAACPRHRCEAHCRTLGFTMSIRVAPEAADLFAPVAERVPGPYSDT